MLANTRFAISPLATTVGALWLLRDRVPAGGGSWRWRVQDAVRERKLVLLGSLFSGAWDYVPDFLTPQPQAPETAVQEELHAVAGTGSARLCWELQVMARGVVEERLVGRAVPVVIREALERGERDFAERVAAELYRLWEWAIAPQWMALRSRMEEDIAHRAQTIARHGLSGMLAGLHPRVLWGEDQLSVVSRFQGRVPGSTGLVLMPSAFATDLRMVIDSVPAAPAGRQPMFSYPSRPGPDTGSGPTVHVLLGVTRARLLADLHTARSTTELGERHFLAASTVSYHLGILHRTGLITRTRTGPRVLYRQTPRAADLLAGPDPR
ncbi:helix-turn-helix transcriptional regulator [Kitasatospora sp. A2-31]|uniref:ArsR/SmtB family transcription factor n=1 Tax=Kitasatospora sp. A2-31 TaxID=2916414 RepID=UPI001EEED052|nr:winged helix-turn-helix domain-containing protein [Kitasatospora sp. A2-31]MCG6499856.1 winged helix-turn-helix domain-containing protein [Kitasatospora sp. A2-31]